MDICNYEISQQIALPNHEGLKQIAYKIFNGQRLTPNEGLLLYEQGELGFVGALANFVREQKMAIQLILTEFSHRAYQFMCLFLQILFVFAANKATRTRLGHD